MKVKVHWIIDGIAEIEAETLEQAEQLIENRLNILAESKSEEMKYLGARAMQGKAYLPGSDEDKQNLVPEVWSIDKDKMASSVTLDVYDNIQNTSGIKIPSKDKMGDSIILDTYLIRTPFFVSNDLVTKHYENMYFDPRPPKNVGIQITKTRLKNGIGYQINYGERGRYIQVLKKDMNNLMKAMKTAMDAK